MNFLPSFSSQFELNTFEITSIVMDKLLLGEVFCIILLVSGCCSHKISFVGMTKKEVAIQQESAPRLKNGDFRILYMTSLENPNQLGHHFHKNKESLLT